MRSNFFRIILIFALIANIGFISSSMQAFAINGNTGDWLKQSYNEYLNSLGNNIINPNTIQSITPLIICTGNICGNVHILNSGTIKNPWYVTKGLKVGDWYKYEVTWVQWHSNSPVEMDLWVKNETADLINLETVVHDGSITEKGILAIGKIDSDPVYANSSNNLQDYARMFKGTLGWLDAFASQTTPIDPSVGVWGHTGIFGEVTLGNVGNKTVSVPAGTFNTYDIQFRDSGVNSDSYVYPDLPFPVSAQVYAIKTSGAPTIGHQTTLLAYGHSDTPPSFLNVQSTKLLTANPLCPPILFGTDSVLKTVTTDTGYFNVDLIYSPKTPHQGCPISWRFKFNPPYATNHLIPDIHFDLYGVDSKGNEIFSLAKREGQQDLYAAVGHSSQNFIVTQAPPTAHYLLNVIGSGPASSVTDTSKAGFVTIDVAVAPPFKSNSTSSTSGLVSTQNSNTNNAPSIVIPSWIKKNAKWWSQGQLGDGDFEKGLQYLIQNGIMKVPHGQSGSSNSSQNMPSWIKKNAGWWADGQISDSDFVKGIQYMITNGLITVKS